MYWSTPSPVITQIGDCLPISQHIITNQVHSAFVPSGEKIEYLRAWIGLRQGTFTVLSGR